MIDYSLLYERIADTPLAAWSATLPSAIERVIAQGHGDLPKWQHLLGQLPLITPTSLSLDSAIVGIGDADDCDAASRELIEHLLRQFHPWRKGPYSVFGTFINSEWRSDQKWERLKNQISPLAGRYVLDVGSGNGYHCWRSAGDGAALAIGIDPTLLYVMQFHALHHYASDNPIHLLPLGIEAMPADLQVFDTVFSMGVFYHRRSPIDHLLELQQCLRPGGELVLETLVIEGGIDDVLVPEGRYAKMRNVWFIPSCSTLEKWLRRCGYKEIRLVDISKTTTGEQRSTDWMTFESLADFLDPADDTLTIEGYPAPKRAIFIANK